MNKYGVYFTICGIILVIAFIIFFALPDNHPLRIGEYNVLRIALCTCIIWAVVSIREIGPTDQAFFSLRGEPIGNVSSGWFFAPLFVSKLFIETKNQMQDELPAEPEKIWDDKDGKPAPAGFFPPIRITFGPPETDPAKPNYFVDNPYDKQMTVNVTPVITWKIVHMEKFKINIGSVRAAKKQMEDVAVTQFSADFAQVTPAVVLRDLQSHNDKLKVAIEARVQDWGIEIISAQIKPFGFSHGLNKAVVEVSEAKLQGKATEIKSAADLIKGKNDALVKEADLLAEAKGKEADLLAVAKGREAFLLAEAVGTAKLAEIAKTDEGKITMWLDTMRAGFEKANHTIIPAGDLFAATAGIEAILEKLKPKL